MHYGLTKTPTLSSSECLVIGLLSDTPLPQFVTTFDKQHQHLITRLSEKLTNNEGIIWQSDVDGQSLLLIHCGDSAKYTIQVLAKRITELTNSLLKQKIKSATICMPQLVHHTPDWQTEQMIIKFNQQQRQFLEYKSKDKTPHALESIQLYINNASEHAIKAGSAIAEGIQLTRSLANAPANICTPTYIAEHALDLASQHPQIKTKILRQKDVEQLSMGAFLAVAKGSHEPLQFIEVQYKGTSDAAAPVVLVGKGITFDSGGISIKLAEGMNEMKYDMGGAASVLGTLKACALLQLPINVIGLMPCTENMPGGNAVKPGDIVTSMSGQTIEIINTDAEGRLVLSDALTYAERFKPSLVIDIATLTGAVIIALGHVASGFMTNDEPLATLIENAARESDDKVWRLPLDDAYQEALDSPLADMVNATFDRVAGSITAACFLSRFTKKFRWAHLDIAGTAWVSGKQNAATGRPVPLLTQLLRHVADSR